MKKTFREKKRREQEIVRENEKGKNESKK